MTKLAPSQIQSDKTGSKVFPIPHFSLPNPMSLRFKLLLIALSTLALPIAGWLFVRQMEELLRQGQEQTLIASARALARSLDALKAELPPSGAALYVHKAPGLISIDGYANDWGALLPYAQSLGPAGDAQKLTLLLCADRRWLYVLADVRDATRTRADATDPRAVVSDHVTLTLQRGDLTRRYLLASAAPGRFDALTLTDASDNGLPTALDGAWQDDGSGYRVELRLPLTQMPDKLALSMFDASAPAAEDAEAMPLLGLSSALSTELGQFAPEGMRSRLLDGGGWVIAETGALAGTANAPVERRRWLENLVYRGLLAPDLTQAGDFSPNLPRLDATEVWQALSGVTATGWHRSATDEGVVLAAAVPLKSAGEVRGALLLEQAGDTLPLLTNRALLSLAAASLFALVVAGGVLFAFASALSLRIRRLRNAAERAMHTSGKMDNALPLIDARDELGDLARSFTRLLDEVGAYTDYLRTLASKLSHELQTPLAIVKSSLDNLDHQVLPADALPYLARARGGAERMGAIVRAMSEASRMERAIAAAEGEDFDLAAVVRGCVEAYRPLIEPRRLESTLPPSPLLMHGAPELIAQALDKLADNARSFAPDGGWISITLHKTDDGAEIAVANSGPLLPPAMQERLFDSLVSVRDASGTRGRADVPHLGLGLYVVRLIAEAHRGRASAHNLADGSGVEFRLHLRGMPRRPLAGGS
jgi:two-component system, OmpR family, sensor histidine kinase ChvG